jgi:glutamate--cysteine ligase
MNPYAPRAQAVLPPPAPAATPPRLVDPEAPATVAACEEYAAASCVTPGPPRWLGVELEWLVRDGADPLLPVPEARTGAALAWLGPDGRLPGGGALSREPGGQVEVSSRPAGSLAECVAGVRTDLAALRAALRTEGLRTDGFGIDPWRPPSRALLHQPRYRAMEALFDRCHPTGRLMMGASASVQVAVDAGTEGPGPDGWRRRWRLAHLLGPVLVAAFANSPMTQGRPTGWRSTRQAVWARLDHTRTGRPDHPAAPGAADGDLRAAWARYALDARVLCVRGVGGQPWLAPLGSGFTFREWIAAGAAGPAERAPTLDDFAYHLGSLFPPVRPHGYFELRMMDAQPGAEGWIVPLAVTHALFEDPLASRAAEAAASELAPPPGRSAQPAPRSPLWLRAARHALTDPALHRAALVCFAAAASALPRLGAPQDVRAAVADFAERYVLRGRCPADDVTPTP